MVFVDPKWTDVRRQVQAQLEEVGHLIGARDCTHGHFEDCEEGCTYSDTVPAQAMLSEFVIVANYVRMDDGEPVIDIVSAPNMSNSHLNGLLFTALYE